MLGEDESKVPPTHKKGKKKGKRARVHQEEALDTSSPDAVLNTLWKSYANCVLQDKPSELEREDFAIGDRNLNLIALTGSLDRSLAQGFPHWKKEMTRINSQGSPLWLILCSSADRCVAIIKELRVFRNSARFGKLFSRHMKVNEQVSMLQSSVVHIAIGTPARVLKLSELGCLKLDKLKVVFYDAKVDMKMRNIFSMKDIQKDLWGFYDNHLKDLLAKDQIQVSII